MITYRKTRKGEWVAFGPATDVKVGAVTVTKKGGATKTEYVTGVGRPFNVNGVAHVYGYLEARTAVASTSSRPSRRYGYGHGTAAAVPGYSSYCTDNAYCGCYDCAS